MFKGSKFVQLCLLIFKKKQQIKLFSKLKSSILLAQTFPSIFYFENKDVKALLEKIFLPTLFLLLVKLQYF